MENKMTNVQRACLLLGFGIAAAIGVACGRRAIAPGPSGVLGIHPNIVFILADDLGYGDVGCYGQTQIQTPNIDALARRGMRFTSAYAGSTVCAPSRCSLLTGLTTGHARIRGNSAVNLQAEDRTIAESLSAAGYDTLCVGKWGLGAPGTSGDPLLKGFHHFYGYIDQVHAHNSYPSFLYRDGMRVRLRNVVPNEGKFGEGVASVRLDYANDLFDHEVTTYIDHQSHEVKPFFVYAAFTAPHANDEAQTCEVPDLGPYSVKYWPESEKRYAALVSKLDGYVGDIVGHLHADHLDANTLVVFTSDNGPHEEGGNDARFFGSAGGLRGIKRDLYEGGIRVPFIASWPGQIPNASTCTKGIAFWDIFPTFAELSGAIPSEYTDGLSVVPLLLGEHENAAPRFMYWEFHERGFEQAIRYDDGHRVWKAVRHNPTSPLELYDLSDGNDEREDVAHAHPEVIASVQAYLGTARTNSPNFPIQTSGSGREAD